MTASTDGAGQGRSVAYRRTDMRDVAQQLLGMQSDMQSATSALASLGSVAVPSSWPEARDLAAAVTTIAGALHTYTGATATNVGVAGTIVQNSANASQLAEDAAVAAVQQVASPTSGSSTAGTSAAGTSTAGVSAARRGRAE